MQRNVIFLQVTTSVALAADPAKWALAAFTTDPSCPDPTVALCAGNGIGQPIVVPAPDLAAMVAAWPNASTLGPLSSNSGISLVDSSGNTVPFQLAYATVVSAVGADFVDTGTERPIARAGNLFNQGVPSLRAGAVLTAFDRAGQAISIPSIAVSDAVNGAQKVPLYNISEAEVADYDSAAVVSYLTGQLGLSNVAAIDTMPVSFSQPILTGADVSSDGPYPAQWLGYRACVGLTIAITVDPRLLDNAQNANSDLYIIIPNMHCGSAVYANGGRSAWGFGSGQTTLINATAIPLSLAKGAGYAATFAHSVKAADNEAFRYLEAGVAVNSGYNWNRTLSVQPGTINPLAFKITGYLGLSALNQVGPL